jgi:thymidine kinase
MNRGEIGYLSICCGCMFSGKTSWLLQQFKKYSYIGKKICVINYADDKRYDNEMLSTHDQHMIPCIQTYSLQSVKEVLLQHDVILINEGQFFNDLYSVVNEMVDEYNKIIHIAALDGDFKRAEFGEVLKLLPKCDDFTKVHALCAKCKDGTQAPFSFRVSDESQQISIGSDNYLPLCRRCYKNASHQNQQVSLQNNY